MNSKTIVRLGLFIAIAGILYSLLTIYFGSLYNFFDRIFNLSIQTSISTYQSSPLSYSIILLLGKMMNAVDLHLSFISYRFNGYVSLLFYILFLLGVLQFKNSSGNEMRLLRFGMSIIFIQAIVSIPFAFWRIVVHSIFHSDIIGVLFILFQIGIHLFWFLTLLKIFKYLRYGQTLQTQAVEHTPGATTFVKASQQTRLFHLIVDTIFCIASVAPAMSVVFGELFSGHAHGIIDRLIANLFFIVCRLFYYPIFEAMLGATPAKFLSQTRVVTESGERISTGLALKRTLSRFVPFEPFSFFSYGWHDKWTKTQVVKENNASFQKI